MLQGTFPLSPLVANEIVVAYFAKFEFHTHLFTLEVRSSQGVHTRQQLQVDVKIVCCLLRESHPNNCNTSTESKPSDTSSLTYKALFH
jgi:hypothetical protein